MKNLGFAVVLAAVFIACAQEADDKTPAPSPSQTGQPSGAGGTGIPDPPTAGTGGSAGTGSGPAKGGSGGTGGSLGKGGSGGTGGSSPAPTCGSVTCPNNATCLKDKAGNLACALKCSTTSECPASAPCCAALSDGTGACIDNKDKQAVCTCFQKAECGDDACAPLVDAKGNPTPGLYGCVPNDGASAYHGCHGALTTCGTGLCCVGDALKNLFCARPCENETQCGGASCLSTYTKGATNCSQKSFCGP